MFYFLKILYYFQFPHTFQLLKNFTLEKPKHKQLFQSPKRITFVPARHSLASICSTRLNFLGTKSLLGDIHSPVPPTPGWEQVNPGSPWRRGLSPR